MTPFVAFSGVSFARKVAQTQRGNRMNETRSLKTERKALLGLLLLLVGVAGSGCVAQPRLEPPARCSTRFPATSAVWTDAQEQANAQAAACFELGDSEGLAANATGVVLRTALVCPLVPVTPVIDAYFAIAMTPVLTPLDLMLARQCDDIPRAAVHGTVDEP